MVETKPHKQAHHVHRKKAAHAHKSHALTAARVPTFIQSAAIPAKVSELQTGVPASITLAQAILESGWGKHHIGDANNYFGVKAQVVKSKVVYGDIATGYVQVPTREHINNKNITINAYFRKYADMEGSFTDHGMFLRNNPRYHAALDAYAKTKDADEFARGLQNAGYATDPHYAELLISIMKKHNLYQYNSAP